MKKLFILALIPLFTCCTSFISGEKDIKAEREATERIKQFTDSQVKHAKQEIDKIVAEKVCRADTALIMNFNDLSKSFEEQVSTSKLKLKDLIKSESNKRDRMEWGGILLGFLGLIIAFFALKKRPKISSRMLVGPIVKLMKTNPELQDSVISLLSDLPNNKPTQVNNVTSIPTDRMIEACLNSEKFRAVLLQQIASVLNSREIEYPSVKPSRTEQEHIKTNCLFYAKESNSMILSNLQSSYQKGKSIFKLTLKDSADITARVGICVEQEEVRQRILKFDSKYLEPVCKVTRSSNEPTEVVVLSEGVAERVGEDWKVVKPVCIEIK